MKTPWTIVLALGVVLVLASCGGDSKGECKQLREDIEAMEQALLAGGLSVDAESRAALMRAYADFANTCHDDAFTPEALFRRADLLRSAGRFQEAMTQLRDVHDHYAAYEKRSVCAFLVGFIAEVELNDREQARKTYQQVIEVHPESEAATWARQSLQNLDAASGM